MGKVKSLTEDSYEKGFNDSLQIMENIFINTLVNANKNNISIYESLVDQSDKLTYTINVMRKNIGENSPNDEKELLSCFDAVELFIGNSIGNFNRVSAGKEVKRIFSKKM